MNRYIFHLAVFLTLSFNAPAFSQETPDILKADFENPPESARPQVWWHWINGNITRRGIKLDLEWMQRVGLGGFHTLDVNQWTPEVIVNSRLSYMTPQWQDAFRYATQLGVRLGLEEGIGGSPGYSETGGPWVQPSEAMKKYVWSETPVQGGIPFSGVLAMPPSNAGSFQTLGPRDYALDLGSPPAVPKFYADTAVIAYREPKTDVASSGLRPKITSSSNAIDPARLTDGDLTKTTALPVAPMGQKSWIQYEFPRAETMRAVTLVMGRQELYDAMLGPTGESGRALEASDNGHDFRIIATIPSGAFPHTVAFPAVTARFFRVTFKTVKPASNPALPASDISWLVPETPSSSASYDIAELVLHPGARVNHFEEKAAFDVALDLHPYGTPEVTQADVIHKSDIVDLTPRMLPDGHLTWNPPSGRWIVVRLGYSLLGVHNEAAPPEATGLEVDKLNRSFVKRYMDRYLDAYRSTVGGSWIGERGLKYITTDSWESGSQNWTDNMPAEFAHRRGYDIRPWIPVLTGHIVESALASDRFLWDFRKTIADLVADEHYGQIKASLTVRGLRHFGEAHEIGRALIADGMEIKKLDDIPMGAMWVQRPGEYGVQYGFDADNRESASVAHIYGQNIAASESTTAAIAPFAWSPQTLKPTVDSELLDGVNLIVIHSSVHQPLTQHAPGITFGPFGQWFTRNETWAEDAGAWIDYLARSSYLLQQGKFAADLVYFYGEDSNLTAIFGNKKPNVPVGYGFDYVNANALIHELSVKSGRIVTKSGMSYRVLALDPYSRYMSVPVLRKIRDLVNGGAVMAGPKPIDTPSLADDQSEFKMLTDSLWGQSKGKHTVGRGIVFAEQSASDAMRSLGIHPDFDYSRPEPDMNVEFVHRSLHDGDIYFVSNRSNRAEFFDATFRVMGKAPELWRADSGNTEPCSYRIDNGRTTVPLQLEPWGAVFVVFRKPASSAVLKVRSPDQISTVPLDGAWNVAFQEHRGAPRSVVFQKLISWSDATDVGVKYFSGSGTYTKEVTLPSDWFSRRSRLLLDLGEVKELAHVSVNGEDLGVVWHTPFRVDATRALRPGPNQLTIRVTNLWVNRLIGDMQTGAKTRYAFTTGHPYRANSPLLPSGLIGPVTILRAEVH